MKHEMWRRLALVVVLTLVSLLAIPSVAEAHKPIFDGSGTSGYDRALYISDPTISWAVYTELRHPGEVDYYTFEARQGTPLYTQMVIPQISGLEQFVPSIVLVGPGLPAPQEALPVPLPPGDGAVLIQPQPGEQPQSFYEPITQTNYWEWQEYRAPAPADGTYYLLVFDPQNQVGKYVLAIGEREDYGFGDLLQLPVIWWKVHAYFGETSWSTALAAATVGVILLTIVMTVAWRRWRRN